MAIAFDTTSYGIVAGSASLITSHTVNSGSNLILWAGVQINSNVPVPSITTVTYNGAAMTAIPESPVTSASTVKEYLYFLVNPTVGTASIVVTASAPCDNIQTASASYTGASQSGVPDAHGSVTGTGTSATLTLTTVADNCWMVGMFRNEATGSGGAGANTTQRQHIVGQFDLCDTNSAQTPAGSHSMSQTFANAVYGALGASFAPAAAAVPATTDGRRMQLLGVGN